MTHLIEQFTSLDKKYRVSFYKKPDGTVTYEQERFADDPAEMFWVPLSHQPVRMYPDLATAKQEALAVISWLEASLE